MCNFFLFFSHKNKVKQYSEEFKSIINIRTKSFIFFRIIIHLEMSQEREAKLSNLCRGGKEDNLILLEKARQEEGLGWILSSSLRSHLFSLSFNIYLLREQSLLVFRSKWLTFHSRGSSQSPLKTRWTFVTKTLRHCAWKYKLSSQAMLYPFLGT